MQWVPTLTLFLFLYPAGWCISHFFYLFNRDINQNNLSIIGTSITFTIFLCILPSWGRVRWKTNDLWGSLGLDFKNKFTALKIFFSGFIFSVFLLFILVLFIFLFGLVDKFGYIQFSELLNAILLILGIVLAEEIVFRGWLMEEMVLLFGLKRGIIIQSTIFSLAHYRSDIGLLALLPFLAGLFLFGLVLTLRRTMDRGSLWGCIGLHGGLVGIWYLIDSGMLVFSLDTPYFFLGPSKNMVNPIGSVIGIAILLITIFFQRRLFSRTGRFLASTVNASFKDETP
tara:strand:- start:255 stop:1106 length:852 start_codon:yes stop_codon:yes gene_type:complete